MNIIHEGTLLKWTNYIMGWKKRYFVLHDGLLEYCRSKGDSLKGKMSLTTLNVKKHLKKDCELIINTGTHTIHLKAQNPKEAQEWFVALRKASTIEVSNNLSHYTHTTRKEEEKSPFAKTLDFKVGELWSIHALLGESIDNVPHFLKEKYPDIEKLVGLCCTFKLIASETLSLLESEEIKSKNLSRNHTFSQRLSIDVSEISSVASPKNIDSPIYHGKSEDSIIFEDAQSHQSEEEEKVSTKISEEFKVPYRKTLPYLRNPGQKINIWKVVKDSVGKELSKIAVPVYFNEPISFLQRFTEDLTYSEVIANACDLEDACMRLAYVSCFGVTSYVSSEQRTMKPFNPLLGETYELVKDGYRVISEQVSHHPPISALHCEHSKFLFWGSVEVKTSFKGTHLTVKPTGKYHLITKQHCDHFIWQKPITNVHNIIFGKIYVDHYGKMEIANANTGDTAVLNFHKKGWFEKVSHEVTGMVFDKHGNPRFKVFGQWNNFMSIQDLNTNQITVVWERYPYPENYDFNYFFSDFAIQLNIPPENFPGLAPTDSRFRPDQRALENGDIKLAGIEKNRLEEKQRETRKFREERKIDYVPKWFYLQNKEWIYGGGYWEARDNNTFQDVPDIY